MPDDRSNDRTNDETPGAGAAKREGATRKPAGIDVPPPGERVDDETPTDESKVTRRQD